MAVLLPCLRLNYMYGLFFVILMLSIVFSNAEATVIYEEFNGSTIGNTHGITYESTPNGQGVVFQKDSESRIEYPFSIGFPREGTIEYLIKVESGYRYKDYVFSYSNSARIFDTGSADVWWPGAMWFSVNNNGGISLGTSTDYATAGASHTLSAQDTPFRFDQWHTVGFSYGSEGQFLMVDGKEVAANISYTESMNTCGNFSAPVNDPTVGEVVSGFWANNQYDKSFEGVIDTLRISDKQRDWQITEESSPKATNMPWLFLLLNDSDNILKIEDFISNEDCETSSHPSVYGTTSKYSLIEIGGNTYSINSVGEINDGANTIISQWFDSTWDNRVDSNPHINTVYDNNGSPGQADGIFEVVSATDESGTIRGTYNTSAYYFSYDGLDDWNNGAITLKDYVDHLYSIRTSYGKIGRLTIFCHGNYALLHLSDNAILSLESISDPAGEHYQQLSRLKDQDILSDDAHILIFSCLIGGTEEGEQFVQQIASLTGAYVHANSEYTGEPPSDTSNIVLWFNYFTHKPGTDWDLNIVCDGENCWEDNR